MRLTSSALNRSLVVAVFAALSITLSVASAIAQRRAEPSPAGKRTNDSINPRNKASPSNEQNERDFKTIEDELRAIREQMTRSVDGQQTERDIIAVAEELKAIREEIKRLKREDSWWFGDGPPVWSNWFVGGIAAVAGLVAFLAFRSEREAVRLTERADVLFETTKFFDHDKLAYVEEITPATSIVVVHKNCGRTTAKNVRVRWRLFIDGNRIPDAPLLPPAIIGAGATLETRLPAFGTIEGIHWGKVGRGEMVLKALGEVTYVDIFDKCHHAIFRGTFYPQIGLLAVDTEETA